MLSKPSSLAALLSAALLVAADGPFNPPSTCDIGARIDWLVSGIMLGRDTAGPDGGCALWDGTWRSYVTLDAVIAAKMVSGTGNINDDTINNWRSCYGADLHELGTGTLFTDDVGWKIQAWLSAYDYFISENQPDAANAWLADIIPWYAFTASQWDDANCGGGIWWSTDHQHKAGISNSLYLSNSARLYEYTGNTTYLDNAKKTVSWMFRPDFLLTPTGYLWDSATPNAQTGTCDIYQPIFTYNQGGPLPGLQSLTKTTDDAQYAQIAASLANATVEGPQLINDVGIFHDGCDDTGPGCDDDGSNFKAGFMNGWRTFTQRLDNSTQYDDFDVTQADAAWGSITATGKWEMSASWLDPHNMNNGFWGGTTAILAAQVAAKARNLQGAKCSLNEASAKS
ncbi:MAG: hypothetical protein MMC23_002594 [Stictis urceolatum]|nr:hypothetical protein [Stictis urceolata]